MDARWIHHGSSTNPPQPHLAAVEYVLVLVPEVLQDPVRKISVRVDPLMFMELVVGPWWIHDTL